MMCVGAEGNSPVTAPAGSLRRSTTFNSRRKGEVYSRDSPEEEGSRPSIVVLYVENSGLLRLYLKGFLMAGRR